jgi:hypothetical protein
MNFVDSIILPDHPPDYSSHHRASLLLESFRFPIDRREVIQHLTLTHSRFSHYIGVVM